jgi:outer membrane protein assembly factor BamB
MTTGHTLWSVKTGGPVTATASIDNGNVYIGSQTGTVYSLKEATGAKVWTFRAGAGVAASGAYYTAGAHPAYVVGDSKGDVYFLRLTSGRVFRTLHGSAAVTGVSAALVWSAVTFADGTVLGSKFGTEIEWAFHARKAVHPVALVSSVTYVAGDDGMVRAFAIPGTQIP